jgi:uncharacterized membrane protein YqjE
MRGASPPGDGADAAAEAEVRGIRELLGRLAASIASAVETRVQLAALEFAEERERARERLGLLLLAAISAGFALLAANALFVVLLWERLGWVSLALLTALWSAIAGFAAWRLAIASRRAQRPFAATLAEFERDRAFLGERFGAGRR